MIDYEKLRTQTDAHPYPLLFATISGAHLYGFPSADSDFDLRGTHVLPLEQVVGLSEGKQTIDKTNMYDGLEIDLVTHDLGKFFGMMLKKNGYVLEQVTSPLVVHTTPEYEELRDISASCVTRHHAHHYLGFAANQWKLFRKEDPPRVKPLLYTFRVILTGIHLMRTGQIEANIVTLNEEEKLPYLEELIERKVGGAEKEKLTSEDLTRYDAEYERLLSKLEEAHKASKLPEASTAKPALNDLLVRIRLNGLATA